MLDTDSITSICLDQLLKLVGIAATGGQAKLMIQGGEVQVNGEVETRRRRKLIAGDVVQIDGVLQRFVVNESGIDLKSSS